MNDDDRLPRSSGPDEESAAPPDGTLVISTWSEPNQPQRFRARLVFRQGRSAQPRSVPSADPEEVLEMVRRWLYAQAGSPMRAEPGS